jgi:hypothetical protein
MISLALAAVLFCQAPAAQDQQTATLRGISSIAVAVDPIAPAAAQAGVTEEMLRGEVAQALKTVAIPVDAGARHVQLTITVNAVPIETTRRSTNGVAYTVAVSVDQEATVKRIGEPARVATWRRAGIGVARNAQARDAIRDQLREYLNAFTAAWKAANSR